MDSQALSAKDRQQLEDVLDQFDHALKDSHRSRLPEADEFLSGFEGPQRDYLRNEMELVRSEVVRGEYVKLRRLGGGGMGDVYLARHVALGREFALKEIKLDCLRHGDRAEFEKRFRREIEACGRLEHHPNLVNVTNTGTSQQGAPYLVMDYIEGLDLKQIVERNGPLDVASAAKIIHDSALGLAHAHEKGLVHRDIKPSNIMVSKHGVVVVLDLGLARLVESDRQATVASMPGLVGSFDYMSPEQCREETAIDRRADIYALGCTLFYLLTGSPPYADAKSIFQKLNAHQQQPLPPVEREDVGDALRSTLARMTAKELDERFQNLHEVATILWPLARDAQVAPLVQAAVNRLRETRPDDESGSTLAYDTIRRAARERQLTATVGSTRVVSSDRHSYPGGAGGYDSKSHQSGSHSSSRIRVAARAVRLELTRRRFLLLGAVVGAGGAAVGGMMWSRRRGAARDFLVTLPGLNGRWWFEETPWLLPEVRWQLAGSLGAWSDELSQLSTGANRSDVPECYEQLFERVEGAVRGWSEDTAQRFQMLKKLDPENLSEDALAVPMAEITRPLAALEAEDTLDAAGWHLLAIDRHFRGEFDSSAAAYERAIALYPREDRVVLAARALADYGQMRLKQRQPRLAHEKFSRAREIFAQQASASEEMSRLFLLETLCAEADAHRGYSNWEPAWQCLQQARPLALALDDEHPLRAVFYERSAWYHFDVWRIDRAEADYAAARTIREANDRAGNHRAIHFVSWNRQGEAMVDYLQDNIARAAESLKSLLPGKMSTPDARFTQRQVRELRERQPNLLERLADTALVDPATQHEALGYLRRAIDDAETNQKFRDDGRFAILIRLKFKAAALAALFGDLATAMSDFALAEQDAVAFDKNEAQRAGKRVGRGKVGYASIQKIAAACIDWLAPDDATRSAGMERLVTQFRRNPVEVTRDELLLLMFVGQKFLERGDTTPDGEPPRQIALAMSRLADLRPRGKAVGEEDAAWRVPPLLARYRKIADDYLARLNQASGESND